MAANVKHAAQDTASPASVDITLDTYSHVLPGLQEAAAEAIDWALDEPEAFEQAR